MNFISGMLKKNGIGGLEAIAALASGKSVADAGKKLAKRGMSKKFEKTFIQVADAYASGYSSVNKALMGTVGVSAGVTAVMWGGMKGASYINSKRDEEDQSYNLAFLGRLAGPAGFIIFGIAFMIMNVIRRQKMLSVLAGGNMVGHYAKFFTIPMAIFFVLLRTIIPSETLESYQVLIIASSLAAIVVGIAKKFYFVYKLNVLEKGVFESIADAFDACKDMTVDACDHEHAGFLTVFNNLNSMLKTNVEQVLGGVDYAEIAREISKSQKFDTIKAFTG